VEQDISYTFELNASSFTSMLDDAALALIEARQRELARVGLERAHNNNVIAVTALELTVVSEGLSRRSVTPEFRVALTYQLLLMPMNVVQPISAVQSLATVDSLSAAIRSSIVLLTSAAGFVVATLQVAPARFAVAAHDAFRAGTELSVLPTPTQRRLTLSWTLTNINLAHENAWHTVYYRPTFDEEELMAMCGVVIENSIPIASLDALGVAYSMMSSWYLLRDIKGPKSSFDIFLCTESSEEACDSGCICADKLYEFRLVSRWPTTTLEAPIVTGQLSMALDAPIAVVASSNTSCIAVEWMASQFAAADTEYHVAVARLVPSAAIEAHLHGEEGVTVGVQVPLWLDANTTHIRVAPGASLAVTVCGCLFNPVTASADCLTPATHFVFAVTAVVMVQGRSSGAALASTRTPDGVPSTPMRVASLSMGATFATAMLLPPLQANGVVVAVAVTATPVSGQALQHPCINFMRNLTAFEQMCFEMDQQVPVVCDGLLPFSTYSLSFTVATVGGYSPALVVPATTPVAAPPRVLAARLAVEAGGVWVQWTPGDERNGPVVAYRVVVDPGNGSLAVVYEGNATTTWVPDGTVPPSAVLRVVAMTAAGPGPLSDDATVTPSRGHDAASSIPILAASLGSAALLVAIIAVILWLRRPQGRAQVLRGRSNFYKIIPDLWELDRKQLLLGAQVGKGAFGTVVFQAIRTVDGGTVGKRVPEVSMVAVKQCARRVLDEADLRAFADELRILKRISLVPHKNVMPSLLSVPSPPPLLSNSSAPPYADGQGGATGGCVHATGTTADCY
jgi:hypothetical protein